VKSLIEAEKLGRHSGTDVLTISFPSTDFLGHQVGPDSPAMRSMLQSLDINLSNFFTLLGAHVDGGIGSVWIALAGDHGVAPSPSLAAKYGMPAAVFSSASLNDELNRELNVRLSPKTPQRYILG
jgi:predicted AlkP superfamily pyrophosphatase or phosphodiesterase